VGKIDQEEHAVNEGITQGDKSIKTPPLEGIQKILEKALKKQEPLLLFGHIITHKGGSDLPPLSTIIISCLKLPWPFATEYGSE
jgi:hypothetical protein